LILAWTFVFLATVGLALWGRPAVTPLSNAPNVLLITVDTLRADHVSSYGYHLKTTPNIDHLASEGARFANAYSAIPLTGPSHFSIFTGRYPQEHGARINGVAVPENSKWLALPQILRKFGYHNAAFISAWPLTARLTGLDRWFDHYDEELTRSYRVFTSTRFAEDVTPRVIQWLKDKPKQPFFVWVHYFDPHEPYHLRERFAAPEKLHEPPAGRPQPSAEMRDRIQRYDSEVGYADSYIGKLLESVDELGLRDSTVVALVADHGESLGEHGYVGHGRRLSQDTVRVPMIFRYPGKIKPGQVIAENVTLLDLTPTLLAFTVADHITQDKIPISFAGMSLAPAMTAGQKVPQRPIRYVTFTGKKAFAPHWLSWMWVPNETRLPLHLGETQGTRKMIWSPRKEELAVYDLAEDAYEMDPDIYAKSDRTYKKEMPAMKRWFDSTNLEDAETTLSERDSEILRSLGYVQ
jgi:arylsulfatase A-like enzyme